MASLGDELRIFRKGQYLDMILFTGVSEIRSFPWKKGFRSRIGFVVFAEIGQVQPEMSKFNLSDNHWGFGIGLRYILNMDELLTIRLDSGMHKDQISTDFGAKEAF
jgi:hypothetical protein